ncbi:DUF5615 family PIN-like protein [Halomarina pelagica]|uniref:DUF5615 family PIN-like protein n=1 Tax=Halomarina pelagica TaxID=2961599 RepID=UPI0020C4976E|nr:DUF5615 family PIN-like protein [Halomarina sp. BND7]
MVRFLLDEHTERDLADKLVRDGHDVERVVALSDLGPGVPDDRVRSYARSTDRIVVTNDDDFVEVEADDRGCVFYYPNQRLASFDLYRIITNVVEAFPDRESFPSVVFLTEKWL